MNISVEVRFKGQVFLKTFSHTVSHTCI